MVEAIFPPSSNWFHAKIISTREDGSVAYGSQNHIFVMEVESDGRIIPCLIEAHKERVKSVAFCPVDKNLDSVDLILSSSDDGFVKIWNIRTHSSVMGHNSHSVPKDVAKVVCASWSPYNPQYAVSVAENDTVVLWNTGSNTTTRFHFSKLKPSVVECSYHNEKIVGVGSKSGMVFIVQLTGRGEILHRLRGHDKEIQGLSWSPIFDITEAENISEKCFLATSCQEKEIFIWKAWDGSCLSKLSLPKSGLSVNGEQQQQQQQQQAKWDPANTFIPLFWSSPNHLYTSSKWGELICCNPEQIIHSDGNQNASQMSRLRGPPSPWKLVHKIHSNAVLAIAALAVRTKKDNTKKFDDWLAKDETRSVNSIIKSFGSITVGFCEPSTLPKQGLIWTIGKDQKLVAVGKDPRDNPRYYLHTINGSAFVSEILPIDPHVLAIGAGDGKIRKWNVTDMSGEAHVFGQKINDRVYSLAWHPCRETVLGFGTSEGRVGIIDVFSAKPPAHFMTTHTGKVYNMSWGPAPTENESNTVDKKDLILYSVGGHKILYHYLRSLKSETFNISSDVPCKKYVDLSWRSDFKFLAVGSKKGYIYILKYPKFEVIHSVFATSKCVMSLTWHPSLTTLGQDCTPFRGYLTFASIDNENVIKVYNCTEVDLTPKMEQVSLLKGHSGYIQFVSWNPHISGRIVSSSADFTVRIWDVTASTQLARINVSHGILPLFCIWSPIDPDVLIVGYTERTVISFRISATNKTGSVLRVIKLEKGSSIKRSELVNGSEAGSTENNGLEGNEANQNDIAALNLAKRNEDQRSRKEERMFKAPWNPEANLFQSCYELLKADETDTVPEYNFSFLKPPDDFFEHLKQEDELFKSSHNWGLHYQLAVWNGNLNEVIEEHITTGQLDDYLLSIAPFVSHRMWQRACEAYAKVLVERNQYRKAATYLLAIHKLQEAVDLLLSANMFLEAICVARCRVPDAYPLLPSLVRKYADWLAETGNTLKASECFIYLKDYPEVVTVLAKKNQPEHLSLAALASRRARVYDLEGEYAYRALVICLETDKFEMASRICSDHPTVKKLYPIYKAHQLLVKLDAKQVTLERDLISHLKELTGVGNRPDIYASLQYIYDRNVVYTSKKNMLVVLAHELILACSAPERDIFLTHAVKALNTASKLVRKDKNDVPMSYKLLSWLYPKGPTTYLTPDSIFGCSHENIRAKTVSLRAYLCLGIADYVSYLLNQNVHHIIDISEYTALLDKLMKYGLDKHSFAYFRDQICIKLVEKNINDAYRKKNEQKENSCHDKEAQAMSNGAEGPDTCLKEATIEPEKDKVSEDDLIAVESEKMTRMKIKMKEFEDVRVSSPNPAVIYCLLREIFEANKETKRLLMLEKKFKELQLE